MTLSDIEKEGVTMAVTWEGYATALPGPDWATLLWNLNRRKRLEVTPKDPEWLKARDKFEKAWNTMNEVGLASGFLEADYEGGVFITEGTEDRRWVYDD